MDDLGVVVIGRNEGQRLKECLQAVLRQTRQVVYADSASTDGSLALAQALGVKTIAVEGVGAARAQNAGLAYLRQLYPALEWVQFVDGDCELTPGWLAQARLILLAQPETAVLYGRQRERFPEASIYHRLFELEWSQPPAGETTAYTGTMLVRLAALQQVGNFDAALPVSHDTEFCLRLRRAGWKIWLAPGEMAVHDGRITRWGQWWRRNRRAGYGYAQVGWLYRQPPECYWQRENLSIWFWAGLLPAAAVGLARLNRGLSLLLLLGYPWLVWRIYRRQRQQGWAAQPAWLYAGACLLGKFPQWLGQLDFHYRRLFKQAHHLIEYK